MRGPTVQECPVCKSSVKGPSKTVSVFVASSSPTGSSTKGGNRSDSFVERKMGMYVCDKCLTRFPIVLDRRHYVMVPVKQLRDMQGDLKRLGDSQERLSAKLEQENESRRQTEALMRRSIDEVELKKLEDRLDYLQSHVSHLKKDKEELEQKIAELAPAR